ncbi:hypothetical protein [Bradyrhizobium sp.]
MSNAQQALTVSGAFGRFDRQGSHNAEDLRLVCAWSLLGLIASALAIASGFGTELAEVLLIAG